jgi:hypothetical protein
MCTRIVSKTPEEMLVDWKLVYRDPLPTWVSPRGRIVLVGDSAHPFLPTSAQGATQALEDGGKLSCFLVAWLLLVLSSLLFRRTLQFTGPRIPTGYGKRDLMIHLNPVVCIAVCLRKGGKENVPVSVRAHEKIRYDRVCATQKTGESTRDMWHKTDWEKVKKDPEIIQFPRQDWIFDFDTEKNAEEMYDEVVKGLSEA